MIAPSLFSRSLDIHNESSSNWHGVCVEHVNEMSEKMANERAAKCAHCTGNFPRSVNSEVHTEAETLECGKRGREREKLEWKIIFGVSGALVEQ